MASNRRDTAVWVRRAFFFSLILKGGSLKHQLSNAAVSPEHSEVLYAT
jgi:hypothetical protein